MLPPAVYAARREAFMRAMGPRAVALLRAPPEAVRNADNEYPYRQSSDLLYLTGFAEPESALVLRPGAAEARVMMYVRPRDPERETWTGRRAGPEGATRDYGADAAAPIDELDGKLVELLANVDDLYYAVGLDPAFDARVMAALARMRLGERRTGRAPWRIVDPRLHLHEMRLHKAPEEIAILERAVAITADAHAAALRAARPGVAEYELQAVLEHEFVRRGAAGPGYGTIVAAGANATILHYVDNRAVLADGDLVLIDAGAEYDGYTADVTRTFPAGGRFTAVQRRCYDLVLAAEEEAIGMVRPGVTVDQIHDHVVEILTAGMVELGLLAGPAGERIADGSYKRYYMHRTSHWLGMDVHDAGAYLTGEGGSRPLEPGMLLTIEPGLYVGEADDKAPVELRGIGVRIEDDVLVTDTGGRNLTAAAPKRPEEMERR